MNDKRLVIETGPRVRCTRRPCVAAGIGTPKACAATILCKAFTRRAKAGPAVASCDPSDPAELPIRTKPTVYIAGGSSERIEVAQAWIARAREMGIQVVYDWTSCKSYDPGWPHADEHKAWQEVAMRDFEAALAADIVWILVPEQLSEGAHTELGIALAARWFTGGEVFVVASGPRVHRNLFNRLANAQFDAHQDALQFVAGLCGLRDGEPRESPQYSFQP